MAEVAPMAEWHPFTDAKSTTALAHDIIVVHSMVGTLIGSWAYANGDGNPYWHFGLNGAGSLWQCQDLRYRSAANLEGNWHCIPIETSDTNEGIWPRPWQGGVSWTQAQLDKLVDLLAWLCVRYDIPPVLIPDTCKGRRGIGYHRQGIVGNYPYPTDGLRPGCEKWSNATGKTCPQDPRVIQLIEYVIPRVRAIVLGTTPPPEEDMDAGQDAKLTQTYKWVQEMVVKQRVTPLPRFVRAKTAEGAWTGNVYALPVDRNEKILVRGWTTVDALVKLGVEADGEEGSHAKPFVIDQATLDVLPTAPSYIGT